MSADGQTLVLEVQHQRGCPVFTSSGIVRFLKDHSMIFGAVLVVLGGFLCIFGKFFFKATVLIATGGLSFILGVYGTFMLFEVFHWYPSNVVFWIIVSCWALVGLCLGFLFMKCERLTVGLMSGVAGFLIGCLITGAFLISNAFAWWAIVGGTTMALCLFGCACTNNIEYLLTSLIGAYIFIRGVSCYFPGTYPSEMELQRELSNGFLNWDSFPKTFYIYMGAFVLLTIISFFLQRKIFGTKKEEEQ